MLGGLAADEEHVHVEGARMLGQGFQVDAEDLGHQGVELTRSHRQREVVVQLEAELSFELIPDFRLHAGIARIAVQWLAITTLTQQGSRHGNQHRNHQRYPLSFFGDIGGLREITTEL